MATIAELVKQAEKLAAETEIPDVRVLAEMAKTMADELAAVRRMAEDIEGAKRTAGEAARVAKDAQDRMRFT